ncbi:hypothetical protein DL96DRAFT_1617019 [Flagelloscypha sp. PMI_526]|nr:hypothetical protein DL96DRAFT_1617019 [Flagelloscypha sp. PMI_526]
MSKQWELPFDILQLLIEFSASSSISTACALSQVSHECQLWSDVHLFRFLIEWQDAYDKSMSMSSLLAKMCHDEASPRLVRARQHVRSLSWFQLLSADILYNIRLYIFLLPNLIQLCVWENYIPELANEAFNFAFDTSHPSLRKVFTCSYTLQSLPTDKFDYPFWKTITHLQLAPDYPLYGNDSPFAQPLLANLNSLTHLAFGPPKHFNISEQPVVDMGILISRLRANFPSSLMLCLLSIERELIARDTKTLITGLRLGNIDERIVLWSMLFTDGEYIVGCESHGKDAFQVWSGIPEGKETFWEAGSAIQKKRRH